MTASGLAWYAWGVAWISANHRVLSRLRRPPRGTGLLLRRHRLEWSGARWPSGRPRLVSGRPERPVRGRRVWAREDPLHAGRRASAGGQALVRAPQEGHRQARLIPLGVPARDHHLLAGLGMDRGTGLQAPPGARVYRPLRPERLDRRNCLRRRLRHHNLFARGFRGARAQEHCHRQGGGDLPVRGALHEVLLLPVLARHSPLNGTANAVVRRFGVPPASETEESHSEDELRLIIDRSTEQGVLGAGEDRMLDAVLSLEDTPAREVMVPRPDVASLPAGMPLSELFRVVATGEHTRYPVHEEGSPDRIVGAVHAKDVMRAVEDGDGLRARVKTEDVMREVLTVPENRRVDAVLQDLKDRRLRMAIVIDEWGSFEGIVTMEDIVEEIVGEIHDEFDEAGPAVSESPDG